MRQICIRIVRMNQCIGILREGVQHVAYQIHSDFPPELGEQSHIQSVFMCVASGGVIIIVFFNCESIFAFIFRGVAVELDYC